MPDGGLSVGPGYRLVGASIFSNAHSVDQIDGYAACFGTRMEGELFGGAAEVCINLENAMPLQLEFGEYWTLMVGLGLASDVELHATVAIAGCKRIRGRIGQHLPDAGEVDPLCVALWGPFGGCPKWLS